MCTHTIKPSLVLYPFAQIQMFCDPPKHGRVTFLGLFGEQLPGKQGKFQEDAARHITSLKQQIEAFQPTVSRASDGTDVP